MEDDILLVACSPRRGGNSDEASRLLHEALPGRSLVLRVTDLDVRPCSSCGFCNVHPGFCSLDGPGDGAKVLFEAMFRARVCVMVSPVYFYHLPAQAKAFVDRAQRFWVCGEKPGRGRVLSAVLFGARPRGEKLFEGAERTLRYMALALGMEWCEPLRLYGLDGSDALAQSSMHREKLLEYAGVLGGGRL